MNKLLNIFMLAFALGCTSTWAGNTAHAAITGKIGVGTWDTQAEFASVKVVKGTQTLYQSNFSANQNGWTTSGGTWGRANGYFRQTGSGTPAMAWVGNTSWTDYTLTLQARKISGSEGFLITFGAPGDVNNYWWNIGGWGNTKHNIQMPGVAAPDVPGTIQTGVWYTIKIQLSGNDIKCYLNGALVQDTTRVLDASERTARIQAILNSAGYQLLTPEEKSSLQELFNRNVYIGQAARDTFSPMPSNSAFAALSALDQLKIIRKVGARRTTYSLGYGFGSDTNRDQAIINAMDQAVIEYNTYGVFDKHETVNNDPGVPTADSTYDGNIRFGQSINYRVALHEMGHTMCVGTYWAWGNFINNGNWTGMYGNNQLSVFDGAGSVAHSDGIHFWPYGLNYDSELTPDADRRHVLMVAAFRRDLGIASTLWMPTTTSIPNGTYRLTPRHAQGSALDVLGANPNNSAPTDIYAYNGGANQQFLLDLQSDGTYRIRTAMAGNRCVEMPGAVTDNGTQIKLWDDNGNNAQRWYFIPQDNGWYKIAPKNSMGKSMDVNGGPGATADGTAVQSWDYLDGLNQQWQLTPVTTTAAAATQSATPASTRSVQSKKAPAKSTSTFSSAGHS